MVYRALRPGPKPLGRPSPHFRALTPPSRCGSRHPKAKLNEILVCDLIADVNSGCYTYRDLLAYYPIKRTATISLIMTGKLWAHVDPQDRQRWVAGLKGAERVLNS